MNFAIFKLTSKEKAAWNSFVAVVRGFLGKHKAENYVELETW